ncbi:MAG: sigma-54-dependent Fis family transcriptional regulator [Acidobacteria bacterium]|nr:MAG: sigma-54-dependent Fis family transcriptional regulator [Acidobacteriota bacterium]
MSCRILVVEDRDALRRMLTSALEQAGYAVTGAADATAAGAELARQAFDLVITDLRLPGARSGLDVVSDARSRQPQAPVIVLTAFGTVGDAVEAMKRGAADFLEKPLEIAELYELVRLHTGGGEGEAVFEAPGAPPIVGRHPTFRAALRLLEKVAATGATVLLTGESGTGKELFARALHALSPRAGGPFVAVNCAAIPESLMEDELFGHEKGAFTGAASRRAGRFERAAGGTLFLDEIGELTPAVQGKVLRVIEERVFERVGGSRSLAADVRLVAATNRDLAAMAADGSFRSDLYFRLDVFPIALPPLRQRASDVPLLARHLLRRASARLGRTPPALTGAAEALLEAQPWPGNVRQLANLLERALILEDGPRLDAPALEALLAAAAPRPEEKEAERIRRALAATAGDKKAAAAQLGISYRTLQRKIRAFDLEGYPKYRD